MRDKFKDKNYFERFIKYSTKSRKESLKQIQNGIIPKERIFIVKGSLADATVNLLISKYSSGYKLESLIDDYSKASQLIYDSWQGTGSWKIKKDDHIFNQYGFGAYQKMLEMLSIGYLLDIPNDKFQLLVNVIDRDEVKDKLFEFIISAKSTDRQPIESESYQRYFGIPEAYSRLRNIIDLPNEEEAAEQMDMYLKKDWYNIQKETGVKDLHNSRYDIYYGYWSFEAAAVVKILGLDDSTFINNQYYPKDLVHQSLETPKKKGFLDRLGL